MTGLYCLTFGFFIVVGLFGEGHEAYEALEGLGAALKIENS